MSRLTAALGLALSLALAGICGSGASSHAAQTREARADQSITGIDHAALPPEARQTLTLIQRGGPFPFPRKDGSVFGNFERRLPDQARGYYREFTVPTPGAGDRGARRIVAGQGARGDITRSGEYYYSPDHYRSFYRIREP